MPLAAARLATLTLLAAALALPARAVPPVSDALPSAVRPAAGVDSLVRFRLEDQFGTVHTRERYAGTPVFIVGGDRGGNAAARAWALALAADLTASGAGGRIAVVPVADLRPVPRLLRRLVRSRFPKARTEGVLLDWEGAVARAHAFQPDECTVLLVGPAGQILRRASGTTVDPAMVREMVREAVGGGKGAVGSGS
jgi:hypothetical protein